MMKEELIIAITFLAILLATYIVARLFRMAIGKKLQQISQKENIDSTKYSFLKYAGNAGIYIVGISYAIYCVPAFRALGTSLFAGAGIIAIVVGFASQQALGNIVSGIFIIIFRPFRINDRLAIQTYRGVVEDISLRHTVIRDLENKRIIIPNSIIGSEIVVNADFKEDNICKWIDISISYDSNIDLAKIIIADEIENHPLHVDNRNDDDKANNVPEVIVRVLLLADSSVNLRAWAWAKDIPDSFVLACDVYESIKKRFDNEGIIIPFPHRTVYSKSPKH